MRHDRAQLVAHYGFPLDTFQLKAFDALDQGESVLVAAPTGSGKTVVAEYAIDAAIAEAKSDTDAAKLLKAGVGLTRQV